LLGAIEIAISDRGAAMTDQDLLMLVQSYVARKDRTLAPADENSAWERFYVSAGDLMRATIRQVSPARAILDDVIQEAWADLCKALPEFRLDPERGTLDGWVKSVASHEAWRWGRRRAKRLEHPLDPDLADALLDAEPGPESELERTHQGELFHARLTQFADRLSARDRRMLTMRIVDHRRSDQIARELGLSAVCVRQALHRLLSQLRDFLRASGLGPT
jgi:RNA polymerase sigma factor (sigma-70 family)